MKFKQGWIKLSNPNKFIKPLDNFMKSSILFENELYIQYKSSLEEKMIKYLDTSSNVEKWSTEPFKIDYIKPTDNKKHRYYIDYFAEINNTKLLIEVKPFNQTIEPNPKHKSYKNQLVTYLINRSKWESAKKFAQENDMLFTIITENELSKL